MKNIVDMTVSNSLAQPMCGGLPPDVFDATAFKIKEIYDSCPGKLFSRAQARKLMKLVGIRCGESLPAPA